MLLIGSLEIEDLVGDIRFVGRGAKRRYE